MYGKLFNLFIIITLTILTFSWTFWIFHKPFMLDIVLIVIAIRLVLSIIIFKDYSLLWSKVSPKTFLIKSAVYLFAFAIYMPLLYNEMRIYFFISELFTYLFSINFLMYSYYFYINKSKIAKTQDVIIYGAGKAGVTLAEEFQDSLYRVKYFIDDNTKLQKRAIDSIHILSPSQLLNKYTSHQNLALLVIAMPSASSERINSIYTQLHPYFKEIKILPSLDNILNNERFSKQLKDISVADLLARHPQDLDKTKIDSFIHNKTILITGAGGSIGSEIVRQCIKFHAKKLILVEHSEYNLYQIDQEVENTIEIIPILQSITNKELLQKTFARYQPDIVIHAAAYKHVPMVEANIEAAIINNIIGTQNCIDTAIEYGAQKFVLISTDKAVRPTNVMGATKRICELYAQNVDSKNTHIVTVRFGNVLGSSGSVIPKFKQQIAEGIALTVTHPDITRYFMLIPEACELVLQAGAIGKGGELFILDMGEPIKIVDLAKKMIELSGKQDINIIFTGLRPGEKLYEELLINESDMHTQYESITVASPTSYPIEALNRDIKALIKSENKLNKLKDIVPEFNHMQNT